ncbi:Gfo/Idh/MocA family protein [Hyphococcus lacteus]|uniref:Gfo/Idh/MocA family oxidoreductase n=1 Tax=Hyphococcus lacteus TaxID=3143536 RepID=A0ABV3Z013_9PROT
MTTSLSVGVAGAGVFGGHHASKYHAHPHAQLNAIFDIEVGKASALGARFNAPTFSDFDKLLNSGLDALVITTPASAHFELAKRALHAGLHVFVEKPISIDPKEADALIKTASRNRLVLQVGHQERYVAATAGLFDRKHPPVKIDCIRGTSASGRCEDVSVIYDLMVHDIDIVRKLTGADVKNVYASGNTHEATADLTLSNDTIVSLKASRRANAPQRRMTLVYEDGIIDFDFINREMNNTTPAAIGIDFGQKTGPLAFRDPLSFGADEFINAIIEGRRPIVTGEDGRDAVAWAKLIEKTAGIANTQFESDLLERQRA